MIKYLCTVILLILVSCTRGVVEDPSISIVEANYPALEIQINNKIYNGLAITEVVAGTPIEKIGITVQGYYSGEARIVSDDCFIDEVMRYEENQKLYFNFPGVIDNQCTFSVVLSPELPRRGTTVLHSLKGHVVVYAKRKSEFDNQTAKVRSESSHQIKVSFIDGPTNVFLRGCGIEEDYVSQVDNGIFVMRLEEFIGPNPTTCVLQGALINGDIKKGFRVLLSVYDLNFVPLAIPVTKIKKNKIKISAPWVVSVLSVGKKYKLDNKKKFKFKNGDIVRAITNKGRLLLGILNDNYVDWRK